VRGNTTPASPRQGTRAVEVFNSDAWKQQWATLTNAPYLMLPLLALVAVAAWWFRGKTSEGEIKGLRERIAGFEDLLKFAAEKAASANEARDEVQKQFQAYKAEVSAYTGKADLAEIAAKMDAAIEKLSAANQAVSSAVGIAGGRSAAVGVGSAVSSGVGIAGGSSYRNRRR